MGLELVHVWWYQVNGFLLLVFGGRGGVVAGASSLVVKVLGEECSL